MPSYSAAEERQSQIDQRQMYPAADEVIDEDGVPANAQRLARKKLQPVRLKMMS